VELFYYLLIAYLKQTEAVAIEEKEQSYKTSFIIGCFQVLSILFPGLSRSASNYYWWYDSKIN
jgi:undecaprenyl pyrophosphate phosphatase UppP